MTRGFLVAALMFLGALAGATGGVDKYALWAGNTALRGANVYQRRVYPELDGPHFLGPGPIGPPYTQDDFERLAAWGANLVVISHPGLFTEEPPYRLDFAVQENLDRLLEMAARAGLFAVISFRTGPGRSEFWAFFGETRKATPKGAGFPQVITTTVSGAIERLRMPGSRCGATPRSSIAKAPSSWAMSSCASPTPTRWAATPWVAPWTSGTRKIFTAVMAAPSTTGTNSTLGS